MHPLQEANPALYAALLDEEFYDDMLGYAIAHWKNLEKLGGYSPRELVEEAMNRIVDGRRQGTWSKTEEPPEALVINTIKSIAGHQYDQLEGRVVAVESFEEIIETKGVAGVYDNLDAILERFIAMLPKNEQQIATMKYIDCMKQGDIARSIQKSDAYVSNVVTRIEEALRDYLEEISNNHQEYGKDDDDDAECAA